MKRIIIATILCFAGMTLFAQNADMSFYLNDYTRQTGTFVYRLAILETVREANLTGIGEFYHEALKYFHLRARDIRTIEERDAAARSAIILCEGLAAEKYSAAAPELWQTVELFDVARSIGASINEGTEMQAALVALGQVGGVEYVPLIVLRLDSFNSQTFTDQETRRRMQRGVVGCISALEALKDPAGYRPVFFVSAGGLDPAIRDIATNALPNILDDPADIIIEIIRNNSNPPRVKNMAWNRMLASNAPDASKARVAVTALNIGWSFSTSVVEDQRHLREMRKGALDTIARVGTEDSSVYPDMNRSYSNNFASNTPDYEEIEKTLIALAALRSDDAVTLLLGYLRDLHTRRLSGPWSITKERRVFQWVLRSIGATRTQSQDVIMLLTIIQRANDYTGEEQRWAAEALRQIRN